LDAWSWAVGSIGEYYPLLLVGFDANISETVHSLADAYDLSGNLQVLPPLSAVSLAALYQGCSAVFHPAPISPWGGPIRLALANGKAIVALETPLADALVGKAAYLVNSRQDQVDCVRALGAALLSVVVEDDLAQSLSRAARLRSQQWDADRFFAGLQSVYKSF
jgi:hypothetical protein